MLKYYYEKRTYASQYVDKESVELVTQWILRLIILFGKKMNFYQIMVYEIMKRYLKLKESIYVVR